MLDPLFCVEKWGFESILLDLVPQELELWRSFCFEPDVVWQLMELLYLLLAPQVLDGPKSKAFGSIGVFRVRAAYGLRSNAKSSTDAHGNSAGHVLSQWKSNHRQTTP